MPSPPPPPTRYWFYSFVRPGEPLSSARHHFGNGVTKQHPFIVEADMRKDLGPGYILLFWREITQEEFEQYQ